MKTKKVKINLNRFFGFKEKLIPNMKSWGDQNSYDSFITHASTCGIFLKDPTRSILIEIT